MVIEGSTFKASESLEGTPQGSRRDPDTRAATKSGGHLVSTSYFQHTPYVRRKNDSKL